jgi:hypothetical protein
MHHLRSFSLSLVFSKCFFHSSLLRHARVCNMSLISALTNNRPIVLLLRILQLVQNAFNLVRIPEYDKS